MTNKRKILYIEDMKECYEKTNEALGKNFEIDWKSNYSDAMDAINGNLIDYSAVISDINLNYDPNKSNNEQTREGLDFIEMIKKETERQGIDIPIICASRNGELYEKLSIEAGAKMFLWKKELWEKGKEVLEALVKKI
jgi:CheY-like chemotaxis protein